MAFKLIESAQDHWRMLASTAAAFRVVTWGWA